MAQTLSSIRRLTDRVERPEPGVAQPRVCAFSKDEREDESEGEREDESEDERKD
jgi:hypothetical protein